MKYLQLLVSFNATKVVYCYAALIGFMLCLSLNKNDLYGQAINKSWQKFNQLESELPTPNTYRTASGAPGHQYWQQRADYAIELELDDNAQQVMGTETITYHNNSPDVLSYLWLQLDQNLFAPDNDTYKTETMNSKGNKISLSDLAKLHYDFDGGFKILYVNGQDNAPLPFTINKTMMRIDLPKPLLSNTSISFSIKWKYNINNRMTLGGRSGYEYFEADKNYLYTIAQFYPRMCNYNETTGWQHKQFLGRSEFTLSFGNYRVAITVPSDHIVAATGELQNPNDVLSETQRKRLEEARTSNKPVIVADQQEAEKREQGRASDKKTWIFEAKDVRDFAFASSRKFIWDAQGVPMDGKIIMAMSFYPKEGNPLWEQYSTKTVAHTLKTYSKYTFPYPYPVAISVHADRIGMEYPMICFNFGRPDSDKTYSARTKYSMISVIIHEVGHNYFPMIVNSDERQWTWMDEGLNSFLQYLAEQEWENNYPSRRGPAPNVVDYMKGDPNQLEPIMTTGEAINQVGNNAYGKTATALNILRETIMGRDLFDYAFKQYAQRWMFKQPNPADFFRTMEDASAIDLDWFWRGWFYGTDPCDISLEKVQWLQPDTRNPEIEKAFVQAQDAKKPRYITDVRNEQLKLPTIVNEDRSLRDFYNEYDKYKPLPYENEEYQKYKNTIGKEESKILTAGGHYYELTFGNKGGLIMPIIVQFEYTDGSKDLKYIPAEIWRLNDKEVSKIFWVKKEVKSIALDPYLETADIDLSNNYYPPQLVPTRFQTYKSTYEKYGVENNIMKKSKGK